MEIAAWRKTIKILHMGSKNASDESKEKFELWFTAYENDFVYEMEFGNLAQWI